MRRHGAALLRKACGGFTLIEMMISIALLMIVSGTVMKGVLDMTTVNAVITNRTDMHNGVRNATELLTQEVGQAGRITVPETTVLSAASVFNATALTVNSTNQLFVNEQVVVDTGNTEETTTVTAINGVGCAPAASTHPLPTDGAQVAAVLARAKAQGIFLRNRTTEPGCEGCLRFGAGVVEHTTRGLAALEEALCAVR